MSFLGRCHVLVGLSVVLRWFGGVAGLGGVLAGDSVACFRAVAVAVADAMGGPGLAYSFFPGAPYIGEGEESEYVGEAGEDTSQCGGVACFRAVAVAVADAGLQLGGPGLAYSFFPGAPYL